MSIESVAVMLKLTNFLGKALLLNTVSSGWVGYPRVLRRYVASLGAGAGAMQMDIRTQLCSPEVDNSGQLT